MTDWKIWEYQVPLHHVLPASGEQRAIRSGYLIQRTINGHSRLTELAPLEGFHGITKQACLEEFMAYMHHPTSKVERSSVTQLAIDLLEPHPTPAKTIVTNSLIDLRQISETLPEPKAHCVKVKMGRRPLDIEIRDLMTLIKRLPSTTLLRIDANRQWGVDEALACARCVPAHQLAYFEEPLDNPMRYADIPQIPIALDESMNHPDVHELLALPNVVAAVLKPSVVGGLNRTRSLIAALKQYGTQAIISSTFESSLTLWAFAEMADPSLTHGLGTLSWFKHPLFEDSIKFNGHAIQLKPNPPKRPMAHCLKEVQL